MRPAVAIAAVLLALPGLLLADHPEGQLDARMAEKEAFFQSAGDAAAPDFELQDADGTPVALADFGDKVVVLQFDDATCEGDCPPLAARLAAIQSSVNSSPMRDMVQFLTVTTDPAADDPGAIEAYAAANGLDRANWAFLTTRPGQPEDATRQLSARFDEGLAETATGAVATHVIDRGGRHAARFDGLEFGTVNLVLYVNGLINAAQHEHRAPPGLWDRLRDAFR